MKLATICAPQWAARLQRGDVHLVLAAWLRKVPTYIQFFRSAIRTPDNWIILDNGAFEGEQASAFELNALANLIKANEVVLPDVLGDASSTLHNSYEALKHIDLRRPVMFVPHGKDLAEWTKCLEAWMGVWFSQDLGKKHALSIGLAGMYPFRAEAAIEAHQNWPNVPLHLLGIQDVETFCKTELLLCGFIRSVDTSLPFALAAKGELLTPAAKKVPLGPRAYERYATLTQWKQVLVSLNSKILAHWCSLGQAPWRIPMSVVRAALSLPHVSPQHPITDTAALLAVAGFPSGQYAVRHRNNEPVDVRPASSKTKLEADEELVVVRRGSR